MTLSGKSQWLYGRCLLSLSLLCFIYHAPVAGLCAEPIRRAVIESPNAFIGEPSVAQEVIQSANLLQVIAKANRLSAKDLSTIQIGQRPDRPSFGLEIFQIGKPDDAFNVLSKVLQSYAEYRAKGYSQEFLMEGIANHANYLTHPDPDFRVMATNFPLFAITRLKKESSGSFTNRPATGLSWTVYLETINGHCVTNIMTNLPRVEEVHHRAYFTLIDGWFGWTYSMTLKSDGSLDSMMIIKCDAKDLDPKYRKMMDEVDKEVHDEMKRTGSAGHFGSVQSFWLAKKEKLQKRGIEWKSPADMNPNTIFE